MATSPTPVPPLALCLGGMDPSGGAGLIRDALTLASLGVHPMLVSTGETMQNGEACRRIVPPSLDPFEQVACLRPHLGTPWGLKLGLCLLEPNQLGDLLRILGPLAPRARIWDPVLAPTSGVGLHSAEALRNLAAAVLADPGWVVTPNRLEAAAYSDQSPDSDLMALATPWLEAGAEAVWLKGGHAQGDAVEDFWIDRKGVQGLGCFDRLPGDRRGTGCAVASAWLGHRLRGESPVCAARCAIAWLREGWHSAFTPGGFGRPIFSPGCP